MNGERYIDHDSAAQVALSKRTDPELERLLDEEEALERAWQAGLRAQLAGRRPESHESACNRWPRQG